VGSREIFNFYEEVVSGATKERKALDIYFSISLPPFPSG
jgi:hypothetical protein